MRFLKRGSFFLGDINLYLAQRLNRRGFGERRLYEFRQTYLIYPQIGPEIAGYLVKNNHDGILRLPTAKLQLDDCLKDEKLRLPTAKSSDEEWLSPAALRGRDAAVPDRERHRGRLGGI